MKELEMNELEIVNGGGKGGRAASAIGGGVALANSIAIGALFGGPVGVACALGGAYAIYNACN